MCWRFYSKRGTRYTIPGRWAHQRCRHTAIRDLLAQLDEGIEGVSEGGKKPEVCQAPTREWIGKLRSVVVIGSSFTRVGFDEETQGWHDKLSRT